MPSSGVITRQLTTIANAAVPLAIAWHVISAVALLALLLGWRPSRRLAGALLATPIASASAVAFTFGNASNGTMLGALAVALGGIALRLGHGDVGKAPFRGTLAGVLMIAFGLVYPHFLVTPSALGFLYAAPAGIIPCPTLSLVLGFSLLGSGLGMRAWSVLLAAAGIFYGVFGVARLGVHLDIVLIVGAVTLLAVASSERAPGLVRDNPGKTGRLPRRILLGLAAFSALSSITGGGALLVWQHFPRELLEHTPFTTFLVPGLLLTFVVGGTSLACAWTNWRRSPAAIDATIFAGGTLSVWIAAEVGMMRVFHWLHALYGGIGGVLLALGLHAAWRAGSQRHRWVIAVTFAETVGFLAPASVGIFATQAALGELVRASLLVAAGVVEGLVLGVGQAWAFPFPVRRFRYALLTALGAGLVWLTVLGMMSLVRKGGVSGAVLTVTGVVAGLIGLTAIGLAQWVELRQHRIAAHRWVFWTALAWVIALPLSFIPGLFVDESTPVTSQLLLWGAGGLLMALAMALVTWRGVRWLSPPLREELPPGGREHLRRAAGLAKVAHPC